MITCWERVRNIHLLGADPGGGSGRVQVRVQDGFRVGFSAGPGWVLVSRDGSRAGPGTGLSRDGFTGSRGTSRVTT